MTANIQRSDVVVIDFAPTQPNAGVRPALIVQNDRDNARMQNTIVAQVTSNIRRANEPTQLLIDPNHPDWQQSGLHRPSVVNSSSLGYVKKQLVLRVIGSLSTATMLEINGCLKAALEIP